MLEDIKEYIIRADKSLLETLVRINYLSEKLSALTLFVVDTENRVVGSVTDGDIRRGLLKGIKLDEPVDKVMSREFISLSTNDFVYTKLKFIREKQIKLVPVLNEKGEVVKIVDFNLGRSYLPIDAVLMAGGKGERLRPMTLTCPNPLLLVADKPIIDYNIDNLLRNGIENINVTVNYLKEQIEAHFLAPRQNGVQVKCVREPEYLGTMGSVKFVKCWNNDTVLVMNSDLFTNIILEEFFLHFKEHNADMSVAAIPYSVNVPYGIFEIDNIREIKGIREKPSFHYFANAGIYLLKKEVLEFIPEKVFFNATDLMELLIQKGRKVIRFPMSGYWVDIGKPEDFKKVQELAKHIQKR